ncbi:SpoIIE family protein phosphatase [Clostridium chromiireducens]|uniref:Serine/threonine protein phosphatase n=1 Tax=Clostridium chromiireducens TaxID=225345 RepID=A0A1V4IXQ9_9CLOT|nr:SpoIIE family protein phosphatase [Clostridium chromiireducens]OPJ64736.1 stage II sporulation protein SpoIIE [Clostridium chromiireducens]RII35961.1 serine/threonine protein phosphatase [Clostridium chromiireducens]
MKEKETLKGYSQSYIKNIFRIILIASIIISLAVIITGLLGYTNTKKSLIDKEKSQDIVFIVKSMASKIDSRINRAVETSYILARDPLNIKWLADEEKDKDSGKIVLSKIESIANSYDYSNTFMAGVKTEHYYFRENSYVNKNNEDFVVLSKDNTADKWFYEMLKSKKEILLNVDYNRTMDDFFLFVDAIVGSVDNPVGITGVGLSLNEITKEFREFKVGKNSKLWMVDDRGIIQLSDIREDIGENYSEFLPKEVISEIKDTYSDSKENVKVSEYTNSNKEIVDYAYCKLSSSDWILFYEIPRMENLSQINSLRNNTIVNVVLVLLSFMILFYIISRKIANPYKQALLINMELEEKVNIRTQELQESNQKISDSIEYAKRLQEAILPSEYELKRIFKDHFSIWRPKDTVGGDFFWLREIDDVIILAVGDCTGHGVPGAFMTMTVNAILHNIVTTINKDNPSKIIRELHIQLKQALNKDSNRNSVDDGLDIAIFCIKNKSKLIYLGANLDLYIKCGKEVQIVKPQSKGVGYSYIELKETLNNEIIDIKEGDIFIVTTDGFIHQNGGQKNYPFGKKRLYEMIQGYDSENFDSIKDEYETNLETYMNNEQQRDDITVFAFKVK